LEQEEVDRLLNQEYQPENEKQRACLDFVTAASMDPGGVAEDIYVRIKRYLTPEEIIELASLVGFWKMYNTIHDSLRIPVEQALLAESQMVGL
jgi:alkylhydroperoxidase family enzyme